MTLAEILTPEVVSLLQQFPIAIVIWWLGDRHGKRLERMHGVHTEALERVAVEHAKTTRELQGDLAERGRALAASILEDFSDVKRDVAEIKGAMNHGGAGAPPRSPF